MAFMGVLLLGVFMTLMVGGILLAVVLIGIRIIMRIRAKKRLEAERLKEDNNDKAGAEEEGYILPPIEEEVPAVNKPAPVAPVGKTAPVVAARETAQVRTKRKKSRAHRLPPVSKDKKTVIFIWIMSALAAFLVIGNGVNNLSYGISTRWIEVVLGAVIFVFFSCWCVVSLHE